MTWPQPSTPDEPAAQDLPGALPGLSTVFPAPLDQACRPVDRRYSRNNLFTGALSLMPTHVYRLDMHSVVR